MPFRGLSIRRQCMVVLLLVLCVANASCFFFRKKDTGKKLDESNNPVLGKSLGPKAGGPDYARLEELYGITTDVAPAAIRPDPDVYVRQLLLQYRNEGAVVAREIGRVEEFRLLLGGASEDFSRVPQDRYDATSLLTQLTVAEEICRALVAPTASEHPGWSSILPASPSDSNTNVRFLAQRFIGTHSSTISDAVVNDLLDILNTSSGGASLTNQHYVAVCTTLALDAQALLL